MGWGGIRSPGDSRSYKSSALRTTRFRPCCSVLLRDAEAWHEGSGVSGDASIRVRGCRGLPGITRYAPSGRKGGALTVSVRRGTRIRSDSRRRAPGAARAARSGRLPGETHGEEPASEHSSTTASMAPRYGSVPTNSPRGGSLGWTLRERRAIHGSSATPRPVMRARPYLCFPAVVSHLSRREQHVLSHLVA